MAKVANVCPYVIIKTNRKTVAAQQVSGLSLFFFHSKTPPMQGLREGVIKADVTLTTNFCRLGEGINEGSWDKLAALCSKSLKENFSTDKTERNMLKMEKITAICNQKSGVGNGKSLLKNIVMQAQSLGRTLHNMRKSFAKTFEPIHQISVFCKAVSSGSGEGFGYASISASRLNRSWRGHRLRWYSHRRGRADHGYRPNSP